MPKLYNLDNHSDPGICSICIYVCVCALCGRKTIPFPISLSLLSRLICNLSSASYV